MGLLYTKFYLDFEEDQWRQASASPLVFEAASDVAALEVEDTSHKFHRIRLRRGAKIEVLRVVGKYRIRWDGGDEA